uniref:Peptidase S1 domain-containing protein n=1 Tax=Panagrolaimus davidi TaxID=227884 RepID=A0A914RAU5_9BILA
MNPIANEASKIAMQINLPILPTCKSNDKDHPVICAGNSTHRPDHGDSGGPLFFTAADGKYYQIGIVHDGAKFDGTADEKNPDVTTFIRISAYCGWITNTTNNEVHCVDMPPRALEPVEVSTEAPKAAPQNGINSMSKNIFIILFTIAVLNVVFMW